MFYFFEGVEAEDQNKEDEIFYEINTNKKLKKESNILIKEVYEETLNTFFFIQKKAIEFPEIFEQNLKTIEEAMKFFEKISLPNNCKCSELIDSVPGWKCLDCSKYDSIYCSKCFLKSKNFHKGHKIHFLPKSAKACTRCDCGEPNNLNTFCTQHKGPYNDMKQINEFIDKSFAPNILSKLNSFFDDCFSQISKYLILTEKCTFFSEERLLMDINDKIEQDDIALIKDNFGKVFQNILNFLYVITTKNVGMLYLVTKYMLKNYLSENSEEKYQTDHICIKLENKKIEIMKEKEDEKEKNGSLQEKSCNKKHNCKCSFLRLLLSNWRNNIKLEKEKENQNKKLLLLFSNNIFIKESFTLLYFFIFKEILLNQNEDLIHERFAFFSGDILYLIGSQTDIIEKAYIHFYDYFSEIFQSPHAKDSKGGFSSLVTKGIMEKFRIIKDDLNYFINPKMKELVISKFNLDKIFLDIACLIHNQCEYKSIFPHPEFQERVFPIYILNLEIILLKIVSKIYLCYDWKDIDKIKTFFNYLIKKIINQKQEGIKQLNENEFSFHLTIYRFLGVFLNYFSFNYAIKNNKKLIDSIEYIKTKIFNSKEEMEKTIDIIINDYFKMFGFITGIRNEYFNYYENLETYNELYFNDLHFLRTDFTLLKYLISMSDKKISLDKLLKVGNFESVYSLFNNIFKDNNSKENIKIEEDEKNHVLQWVRFFEIIILIMKNDSTHFWAILTSYNDIIFSKTKSELFDSIINNDYLMNTLKNNLKEKIIMIFISSGNSLELKELKQSIDEYYFKIFTQKQFDEILDSLTVNTIDKNKKRVFSLKDSSLKFLDMNYFLSPSTKSKAELYINDFKKDVFKSFNSYYFKPSMLTFEFHNKVFENILLNNENIEILIKIISKLLSNLDNDNEKSDTNAYIKSIRDALLPIVLNYLTMFGIINSKNFIKYKIENKDYLNKITDLLNNALKNNKDNKLFDDDIAENISNTINQLFKYKIIYDDIKEDLNKLDDFDYNINYKNIEQNEIYKNKDFLYSKDNNLKHKGSNKLKEKYKNLIKQKRQNFMEKIQNNKEMTNAIESDGNKNIDEDKNKDQIICLFCTNLINLDSFEQPYGKMGYIYKDYFYKNCFKSSLRNELKKIAPKDIDEKNTIYSKIKENKEEDISTRILSCGHYFHFKCFEENGLRYIKCPVCLKIGNILIPPLTIFYGKEQYLKSEKLDCILNKNKDIQKLEVNQDNKLFKLIKFALLREILGKKFSIENSITEFKNIVEDLLLNYQHLLNYVGNIFYSESTTFFRREQVDNIQNALLIIRYLVNINYIDIKQIIKYIREEINIITKGPNEKENVMENFQKRYYSDIIDKIILLLLVLSDYDEIQKLFAYILNWTLPYLYFWIYLRNIIINNNFYSLFDDKIKETININNYIQFLKNNNKMCNDYLEMFLQKLLLIKIISKYDNNKDNLFYNINSLSTEKLFDELNMKNLYPIIPKNKDNEINIIDIFEILPKYIISDNSFKDKDYIIFDSNKIIESLINNIVKQKEEKALINPEFLFQFILYKFDFIELENNIFDFIEKSLFEECDICHKLKRDTILCLICGNKVCLEEIADHTAKCTLSDNVFLDMKSMTLFSFYNFGAFKLFDPIYTKEFNESPNSDFITNEYNLNLQNLQLALKNYISRNFH